MNDQSHRAFWEVSQISQSKLGVAAFQDCCRSFRFKTAKKRSWLCGQSHPTTGDAPDPSYSYGPRYAGRARHGGAGHGRSCSGRSLISDLPSLPRGKADPSWHRAGRNARPQRERPPERAQASIRPELGTLPEGPRRSSFARPWLSFAAVVSSGATPSLGQLRMTTPSPPDRIVQPGPSAKASELDPPSRLTTVANQSGFQPAGSNGPYASAEGVGHASDG